MDEVTVSRTVYGELRARGYEIGAEEFGTDLISAGVNSVNLVRVLSALEDAFDVEFDAAALFTEPITVARLTEEVVRRATTR